MVASIGVIASPSQGVSYYEKDGYYAKDDPTHKEASAWAGRGAEALGLSGPVDADTFRAVLEGKVPEGPHLGKRGQDGDIHHRPGRGVTLSAPKSVSLMALVGGDERIVAAHDRAVTRTLAWIERNAVESRMQDKATGAMVRAGHQKMVAATFRHDTSRNLDPQLHTHAVIANMVQGEDGKWRTMVDDGLFAGKMAIGAIYRGELTEGAQGAGVRDREDTPKGSWTRRLAWSGVIRPASRPGTRGQEAVSQACRRLASIVVLDNRGLSGDPSRERPSAGFHSKYAIQTVETLNKTVDAELRAFLKKTRRTPKREIALALRRAGEISQ